MANWQMANWHMANWHMANWRIRQTGIWQTGTWRNVIFTLEREVAFYTFCTRESGWQSGRELDFYPSNPGSTSARVSTTKKN